MAENCEPCVDCQDVTPPVEIPTPPECDGENCDEIIEAKCVRYTGPAIACLNIATGDNLETVIEKLAFCFNDQIAEAMLNYILNDQTLKSRLCAIISDCGA